LAIDTAGSISGTPVVGGTLTYATGQAEGGQLPYTYTWEWRRASDNAVLQTNGSTLTIPAGVVGDTIYVFFTVTDAASSTATDLTSIYPTGGQTIIESPFANLNFSPSSGPNASPADVNTSSLKGTATATWPSSPSPATLTVDGDIQISINGGAYGAVGTITSGQSLSVIWNPASIAGAATGATLTGSFTDGTSRNQYSITIDRSPSNLNGGFSDVTDQPVSQVEESNLITLGGFNVPVTFSVTGASSNPLTAVGASISGGAYVTSGTVEPGDTLRLRGTTGASPSVAYGMDVTLGEGPGASENWTVTTSAAVAAIAQPTITAPSNGATGVNPATQSPSAVTITGSSYLAQNGAGSQTSSTWELYEGGFPLTSSSSITALNNGTGGSATQVEWKTSATSDSPAASFQNLVYGKPATDAGATTGSHPMFAWAAGLTINGFTDWYIPALYEMETLYYFLKPTSENNDGSSGKNPYAVAPEPINTFYTSTNPGKTSAVLFQVGNSQAFFGQVYWPSSESSADPTQAWRKVWNIGNIFTRTKDFGAFARAIRRITISEYNSAGAPAIGEALAGGYFGGKISTVGNGNADYALIVAPNPEGTYAYTGGTSASLEILNANTDGFQVGSTILGSTSNAKATIQGISGTQISYLASSGSFVVGETVKNDPASYFTVSGSPFTVSSAPFTQITVPESSFLTSTIYYARTRYATTNATAATSPFSSWSQFTTTDAFIPAPGTAMDGGYFAGQIKDGTTIYNLIVAPKTSGTLNGENVAVKWRTFGGAMENRTIQENYVYGAGSTVYGAGRGSTYPGFDWCIESANGPNAGTYDVTNTAGTGIGGYNDWYIPALYECYVLYYYLKPTSQSNLGQDGAMPNNVVPPMQGATDWASAGPPVQTTAPLFIAGASEAFNTSGQYWTASAFQSTVTPGPLAFYFASSFSGNWIGDDRDWLMRAIRRVAA
jgi:hypothetical protein